MTVNNTYLFFVVLYISTSQYYWFFLIQPRAASIAKVFLLGCTCVLMIILTIRFYGNLIFPKTMRLKYLVFLIIWGMIINLLSQNYDFGFVLQHTYIGLVIFIFSIYFKNGGELKRVVFTSSFFVFVACIFCVLDWVLQLGLILPNELKTPLYSGGFNSTRTGWASGLAMFSILYIYYILKNQHDKSSFYLFLLVILILFAQLFSGGRGGILTTTLALFVFTLTKKKWYLSILGVVFVSLIFFFLFSNYDFFLEYLRFNRLDENGDFSSGRYRHYTLGFQYMLDNNFIPKGYNSYTSYFIQNNIIGSGVDQIQHIHNVWFASLVQFGLPFLIAQIMWVCRPIYSSFRHDPLLSLLILIGLIPTFLEPSVIFKVVTNYVVWWFLFTYLCFKNKSQR